MLTTSKKRVMLAVNHEQADRIPITFDAEKEVYAALYKHFGVQTKEHLFDKLHADTWMILPAGFEPTPIEGSKEKESIWGFRTKVSQYSAGGTYDEICFNPLADKDNIGDIKKWKAPTDDQMDFSNFSNEVKDHSDRAIIGVFAHGAYFIATDVRGLQNILMDFALNKKYAHYLIDKISERIFAYLEVMLEEYGDGIDIVYMADDYCSQQSPLFSPAIFREFVMPYLTRVVEKVHKYNKKFLLHCCGAVRPLLPMIIEAGVDMLEPIQIKANGMSPEGLKKDFGKDICFYGGVDIQEILCSSTPEQVSEEVKRLIDILGQDGGYVLGPGHTYIQIDAPARNILAMYETAASYH